MDVLASRILLRTRDLDASLAFYEGILGLTRFREFGSAPHRGVVLFLGGGYLELTETARDASPEAPAGVRVWLQVPDIAAVVGVLHRHGVAPTDAPELKPWGLIEATVNDPDGLTLVLVEVPGDHPLRRDTR